MALNTLYLLFNVITVN